LQLNLTLEICIFHEIYGWQQIRVHIKAFCCVKKVKETSRVISYSTCEIVQVSRLVYREKCVCCTKHDGPNQCSIYD